MDQPKIERMLRLLKMMSGNNNYTIEELAKKLDTSYRSIYRYIDTFKASGFTVIKVRSNVYKIGKMPRGHVDMSKLIYFSEEEAFLVNSMIDGLHQTNQLKTELKKKLAAVYSLTSIADYVHSKECISNIHKLEEREVCICSFTRMPLFTLPPSSPTRVVLARTPTAMTRISNSTVAPLFIVALFPLNSVAVSPSINLIRFSSRRACMSAAHSSSRMLESTLVARSQTVTEPTRPEIPSAHLSPIRPAPTINTTQPYNQKYASLVHCGTFLSYSHTPPYLHSQKVSCSIVQITNHEH